LGSVGGTSIGAYSIVTGPEYGLLATANGGNATSIYSDYGGTIWSITGYGPASPGTRTHSWAAADSTSPGAYTT
jgi:hypothetical protein